MHEKSSIAARAIKGDPMRFARLSLKRAAIFWTALGGNRISRMVIAEITAASLFGVVGVIVLLRRRAFGAGLLLLPFLLFPLPYYITHPDFRFRLLLQPIALMLMGWAIVQAYEFPESRRARPGKVISERARRGG
jgi:asparagine N-glycosylation enzyme membrane subunit Stt3